MKRFLWILMACLSLSAFGQTAADTSRMNGDGEAKAWIGYLSYDRVLRAMPRYGLVQQQLSGLRQQYEAEAKRSADDFNRKYEEFLEGRRDFPPSILRKRQVELQELMQRNVAFKEQGLRELAQAEDSLMTPLRQQLDQALDSIGSELGYALIVNTDAHACPYINPLMGEDITAIVIRRLENKK